MYRMRKSNRQGNILLVTAVIILILTVIVTSTIKTSGMQASLSNLNRNTSNTYYLAKSGAEKQIDTINKAIETNLSSIIKKISDKYIKQISEFSKNDSIGLSKGETAIANRVYNNVKYSNSKIQIIPTLSGNLTLSEEIKAHIYKYICDHYVGKDITYEVKSDRKNDDYKTVVTVKVEEMAPATDEFLVISQVETKDSEGKVYDSKIVQAILAIHVPHSIQNQIHERYRWAFNPSELLSAPLTTFSDVVVTGAGNKLIVNGDMRVKGYKKYTESELTHIVTSSMDPDMSGGVIANQGGSINVSGNLYTTSNVMVSNGWGGSRDQHSSITVGKDVIASTMGIVDDFYEGGDVHNPFNDEGKVTNASIKVGNNVFVENDVMIDRWAKQCEIIINGTILGVSRGDQKLTVDGKEVIDPNLSSSVYSQGEDSTITAVKGVYVAGQPFITLENNTLPKRLYESVGEPFDGVSSWGTYNGKSYAEGEIVPSVEDDYKYLLPDSPFNAMIKRNKILTDLNNTYAPGAISAKNYLAGDTAGNTVGSSGVFGIDNKYNPSLINNVNPNDAEGFLCKGGTDRKLNEVAPKVSDELVYTEEASQLVQDEQLKEFLTGYKVDTLISNTYETNGWIHFKDFGTPSIANKMGVLGYMNAMRSVFLGTYLKELEFKDLVSDLSFEAKEWSYDDPIKIVNGSESIDISTFYIDDGTGSKAVPTIIINVTEEPITLRASNGNSTYNGIIISKGKIYIEDDITINGSVIIGEQEKPDTRLDNMLGKTSGLQIRGQVTINEDPDMILKVTTLNHHIYRSILDALNITNYNSGSDELGKIYGPYKSQSGLIQYTRGQVFLSNLSYLEVDTKDIYVKINEMRQVE